MGFHRAVPRGGTDQAMESLMRPLLPDTAMKGCPFTSCMRVSQSFGIQPP